MNTSVARLALFLVALSAVACGGKTVSSDPSSSSQQAQSAGAGQKGSGAQGSSSGSSTPNAPSSGCVDTNMGGGSSGVDGNGNASYTTSETFQCPSGEQTIECTCSASNGGAWGQGTCSCNGITFAFDCANGGPGAAEYAKCGFPAPAPSSSNEGSTSSSSGYSSSGSSGSSSGSSGSGSSSSSSGG